MKPLNPSQITIGLTTFNRKNILLKCLPSLKRLNPSHDFLICDDCSTEYDSDFLITNFQNWRVYRSSINSGRADFAMARLMDLFIETGREYLVILDSDLLVDPDLTDFVCSNYYETDGVFSLFNTPSHSSISEKGRWIIKNIVGAAATVWKKELLIEVRKNVPVTERYDWDWSQYLQDKGVNIYVSKRSYVQHLGFSSGQNSNNFLMGDLGLNFKKYGEENLQIILDEYLHSERQYLKETINTIHSRIINLENIIAKIIN